MTIINKSTDAMIPYISNPSKNSAAVDKVAASINEGFGFSAEEMLRTLADIPCLHLIDEILDRG